MTVDELLAYALSKPGAWQDEPWEGDLVAKVGEKIFAFFGGGPDDPPGVGLKCAPTADEAREWRDRYPNSVSVMAYIGRYGWNTFRLDGAIPDDELRELVDASYDAVVAKLPKSQRP